jgi:formate dehydrogenase major subunit
MKPKMRLTAPLVRDGDGELRETSWEDALARATTGLERARDAGALSSFGMFSCSKATNEMNFVAQKFARQVMGTNNIDSCNRT